VTYLAVAPESDLVQQLVSEKQRASVTEFVQRLQSMSGTKRTEQAGISKEGLFLGSYAIHPLTQKPLPIYIADYVIADFAEGCVMGVPAHDTRDFEFAKKHNLDIIQVIQPVDEGSKSSDDCYTGTGKLVNSEQFNGQSNNKAKKLITDYAQQLSIGSESTQYKIRDWLVSRQRYWGAPIPIIHCPNCGPVPVNESDLPVKLPDNLQFQGNKGNPLAQAEDWVNVKCPCGKGVDCKRETDTMDTFVDSSWYYLRYTDPHNSEQLFSKESVDKWMNVDYYIGGIEHAVLHLLYARYIQKFLYSQGYVKDKEPFKKLLTQGMVHGETFKHPETDRYYKPHEIEKLADGTTVDKEDRTVLKRVFEKMSKSKYNGVDPTDIVAEYGSDVIRLYILFKAPIEKELEWDPLQISGQKRFIKKTEELAEQFAQSKQQTQDQSKSNSDILYLKDLAHLIDQTRRNIFDEQVLNTCISNLHKYMNILHDKAKDEIHTDAFELAMLHFPTLLAPFAPSYADKMFKTVTQHLNKSKWTQVDSVHQLPFPTSDELLQYYQTHSRSSGNDGEMKIAVAINGKSRAEIVVKQQDLQDHEQLKQIVTQIPDIVKFIEGKAIVKVIVVQGKLVNFVVK
jgi:leucyl-tRNA synthetase